MGEYNRKGMVAVAKMTYNAALTRRLTRGSLIDDVGIKDAYWNLVRLTDDQFLSIVRLGGLNARLVID